MHIDNDNLFTLNGAKPKNQGSEDLNFLTSDKVKEFVSKCDLIQNFLNPENDDDVLPPVNSKYHNVKSFNKLKIDAPSSFGLFHVNIASLNKHIDDLRVSLVQVRL